MLINIYFWRVKYKLRMKLHTINKTLFVPIFRNALFRVLCNFTRHIFDGSVALKTVTLLFLISPILCQSQDYSFDGTWEGTYYHQSLKLEVFLPCDNSPNEYYCHLLQAKTPINCVCFTNGNSILITNNRKTIFELYSEEDHLETKSHYSYSFFPEPLIESYSEDENY